VDKKQAVATDIALAAVTAVGINSEIRVNPFSAPYPRNSEDTVASVFLAFPKMNDRTEDPPKRPGNQL